MICSIFHYLAPRWGFRIVETVVLFTIIFFLLLGALAQYVLRRKLRKYGGIPSFFGLSGKEIAEKMLAENGIRDVQVVSVQGVLSDHYNPVAKTVNLSRGVYEGKSIAAVAVAAHECGHAVQHARAYGLLTLRTTLVPIQNVSARVLNFIFMMSLFGVFAGQIFSYQTAMLVIAACYFVFTLFSLITLPVEFDASRRALLWIQTHRGVGREEYQMAKDALQAAAMTYVVAALASLTLFLQYLLPLLASRD